MSSSRRFIGAILTASAMIAVLPILTDNATRADDDPLGLGPNDEGAGRLSTVVPGPNMAASQPLSTEPVLRGNPLWKITVDSLRATRDRPLFSASRRPPPPIATPIVPLTVAAPPEPEKPQLDLIGVITGTDDGYAVFINTATHAVVSLRTGEGHDGWVLQAAEGRHAVLERHHRTVVVTLPKLSQNKQ